MAKTEKPASYDGVAVASHSNFCRSQQDFACHQWAWRCVEVQETSILWRGQNLAVLQLLFHSVGHLTVSSGNRWIPKPDFMGTAAFGDMNWLGCVFR